jgi:hypothetical protein
MSTNFATFNHFLNFADMTPTLAFEGGPCRMLRALPPMHDA